MSKNPFNELTVNQSLSVSQSLKKSPPSMGEKRFRLRNVWIMLYGASLRNYVPGIVNDLLKRAAVHTDERALLQALDAKLG